MPLRESNPVKVALVLWIGVLLLVRGVPFVQHRVEEHRDARAALHDIEAWGPAVRALNALPATVSLTRCRDVGVEVNPHGDAFDRAWAAAFASGYPCWSGPGGSMQTASTLVTELRAAGATSFATECVQLPDRVWCDVRALLKGVPVGCTTRPELLDRAGALRPDPGQVRVECSVGLRPGERPSFPARWKRVPLRS